MPIKWNCWPSGARKSFGLLLIFLAVFFKYKSAGCRQSIFFTHIAKQTIFFTHIWEQTIFWGQLSKQTFFLRKKHTPPPLQVLNGLPLIDSYGIDVRMSTDRGVTVGLSAWLWLEQSPLLTAPQQTGFDLHLILSLTVFVAVVRSHAFLPKLSDRPTNKFFTQAFQLSHSIDVIVTSMLHSFGSPRKFPFRALGTKYSSEVIRHTSELYFVPRPFTGGNGNGRGEPNVPRCAECVTL